MSRTRSPGYPSISLRQAIELSKKIHDHDRTNPIDREAAAKNIGYSGITGASAKALADLAHYGLVERAGKGSLRVAQLAVDILYPVSEAARQDALEVAATNPDLFAAIRASFPDGVPSDNNLRGYLMRQSFASAAIPYAIKSYTETARLLVEAAGNESHGEADKEAPESFEATGDGSVNGAGEKLPPAPKPPAGPLPKDNIKVTLMEGERVIFMDEVSPGQYLKVIASGDLDASLIEAMEDFTKRRRKRLPSAKTSEAASGEGNDGD